MTIPTSVRAAVGLSEGDLVEVTAVGKRIVITPKVVIDRSKFPSAAADYTAAERRTLDAVLNEAEQGPFYGPFQSGAKVGTFLKRRHSPKRNRSHKAG